MNRERLYLDYNATSPLSQSVLDWLKSGDLLFANPSSQHSSGKAARKLINEAKAGIYKTFQRSEKDSKLFFHSGATEASLTFTHSFSELARAQKRRLVICYAKTDHPAVTTLQARFWGEHVSFFELGINQDLTYDHDGNFQRLSSLKAAQPDLIILYHHLWVHNETGLVSPLEDLKKIKTIPDLYVHVDAVQAPGKVEDWQSLREGDVFSFSAHKFGALKGLGFSFFPRDLFFSPLISGGGQQQGMRSGTENALGVHSISLALGDLTGFDVKKNKEKRASLATFMLHELQGIGEVISHSEQNSNTVYFYFNKLTSDIALALFDIEGVEVSAGSACSSGAAKDSVVLLHMGHSQVAKNGLRLSFGFNMTHSELEKIEERLKRIFERIRKSPL